MNDQWMTKFSQGRNSNQAKMFTLTRRAIHWRFYFIHQVGNPDLFDVMKETISESGAKLFKTVQLNYFYVLNQWFSLIAKLSINFSRKFINSPNRMGTCPVE